jgi:hypothetical protein
MSLYHYTDIQAVHSILDKKKIWLTDIRFLNDKKELLEGLKLLNETLLNEVSSDLQFAEQAAKQIRLSLTNIEAPNNDLNPLYVFSLSTEIDLLSQWRAYGSYALEFDEELLHQHLNMLYPCLYSLDEKIEHSASEVEKSIKDIATEMEANNGSLGPNGYDSMINLMHDAARFKHEGFKEEKECRVIVPQDDKYEVKFRPRKGMLIPYIEVEIPLDCIKSIQLGPMQDQELAFISIRDFAAQIERKWHEETSNNDYCLQIEKSLIPYRTEYF